MIELKQLLEEGGVKYAVIFGENVPEEIRNVLQSILAGQRMYWVQNADPKLSVDGDYRGYLQDSWEEAISVAEELALEMDQDQALEVLELAIVRTQIVKPPELEQDDEE